MAFDPSQHMMDLKGKKYLPVRARIQWLVDEHPQYTIETKLLDLNFDHKMATVWAKVMLPNGRSAEDIGSETEKDFPQGWVEKAATKAIGRALASLGLGTAFALELDEGERIVDSPVQPHAPIHAKVEAAARNPQPVQPRVDRSAVPPDQTSSQLERLEARAAERNGASTSPPPVHDENGGMCDAADEPKFALGDHRALLFAQIQRNGPAKGHFAPKNLTQLNAMAVGLGRVEVAEWSGVGVGWLNVIIEELNKLPDTDPAADDDDTAKLRAHVAKMLADDPESAAKLPKGADKMTPGELDKTQAWLAKKAERFHALQTKAAK